MTDTIYFMKNTDTVWTLENANFNDINRILLFRKMVHDIFTNWENCISFIHFIWQT